MKRWLNRRRDRPHRGSQIDETIHLCLWARPQYKFGYPIKEFIEKHHLIFIKLRDYYIVYLALILVYIKNLHKNELKNYLILFLTTVAKGISNLLLDKVLMPLAIH